MHLVDAAPITNEDGKDDASAKQMVEATEDDESTASEPASDSSGQTAALRLFMHEIAPQDAMVQCYVKRIRTKILSLEELEFTRYELYLKDGDALLAYAQRQKRLSMEYVISAPDGGEAPRLGKLKFNLAATEFSLVDSGSNVKKMSLWDEKRDTELQPRRKLCSVVRHSNRNMQVNIMSGIAMSIKQPQLDPETKRNILDFGGRVTVGSVKNFQLCEHDDQNGPVLLQFGRIGKDAFNLDFRAPLSALVAFGIALTVFGPNS